MGRHGRKRDFPDAERLVKRLVAQELTLSFVPDVTQRLWRTVTRRKYQLTRNRVQLQNRLESLLEEAHIKVSTFGVGSARRECAADAPRHCQRRDRCRHRSPPSAVPGCTPRRSSCATRSGPSTDLHPLYRRLLAMTLAELRSLESHMQQLDEELAGAAPRASGGRASDSRPFLASVSIRRSRSSRKSAPRRRRFPRPSAWRPGWAPVRDTTRAPASTAVTAPRTATGRCVDLLNQAAHAAVKTKGSIFELLYRRFVVRLGHAQAIGAIAHRLCRLVWKILHDGVTYEERGPAVSKERAHRRAAKMIRELRSLGYRVDITPTASGNA